MRIRDRIREIREVSTDEILPNPRNWRTHPEAQRDALQGILAEVGNIDVLKVFETPNGLMLIDGHLRAETIRGQKVKVAVLDLDEDEAAKVLLTFDPLAAMASRDEEALAELLAQVETDSTAVQAMLDGLAQQDAEAGAADGDVAEQEIPESYQVLVQCQNELHQTQLLERFQIEGLQCRALIS